jgi:hypothetical protein
VLRNLVPKPETEKHLVGEAAATTGHSLETDWFDRPRWDGLCDESDGRLEKQILGDGRASFGYFQKAFSKGWEKGHQDGACKMESESK